MRFEYDRRLCRMASDWERERFGDLRGTSGGRRTGMNVDTHARRRRAKGVRR